MPEKILIANRGEIALRIQRTCRELGIQTVMIYSEGDANAKYLRLADETVCIGPAAVDKSYLNSAAIIAAAEITEADAIHPGYGLLSENADFAEQVQKSGFAFIGPSPSTIRLMGDKIAAKQTAKKYGLKVIPDSNGALSQKDSDAAAAVSAVGYPRGMRVVQTEMQAMNTLPVLRQETQSAFGDGTLYAERYLENPRHVEVQVLGDGKQAIHLGTRDCSMQRRHQKIIEEAPAPGISAKKQNAIGDACAAVCRKMGYAGAGTFEFLYADDEFYFIEMNTRLQVEHPVTEMITGLDIVSEQIKVTTGEKLSLRQKDVRFNGHAMECRINAEDPTTYIPSPGKISFYHAPGGFGVRVDSHVYSGYDVPPFYDSLLSKLVSHGATRQLAMARMRSALQEYVIEGIATNLPLHSELVSDPAFLQNALGIKYLEKRQSPA